MSAPRWTLLACFALGLVSAPALADVVHLKSGKKIEGKVVRQDAAKVEVETKFGLVSLDRKDVERIDQQRLPKEELQHRIEQAGSDATRLWEAAEYAKEHKLHAEHRKLLERVVEADPTHSEANQALGKVYHEGRWFTPEELQAFKDQQAREMEAQGKVLYKGHWIDADQAKRLQGFELYKGQWLRLKEIYLLEAEEKMPELLGINLPPHESEHFILWSELSEDTATQMLETLETGFAHFLDVFKPDENQLKIMTFYPIAVYVLPNPPLVTKFVEDGGYMIQLYNPPKDINERYLDATSFPVFFPRPLIVTSQGRHLGASPEAALTGYLAHYSGNMFIRRYKQGGAVPGWIETGLSHYYEAMLNGFRTLSITEYTGYERVEKWKDGLRNFPEWYKKMSDPAFRAKLPRIDAFKGKIAEEIDGFELVKAYFMVTWLMEEKQEQFVEYARTALSDPNRIQISVPEAEAFAAAFKVSPEQLEAEFETWAAKLPSQPPVR